MIRILSASFIMFVAACDGTHEDTSIVRNHPPRNLDTADTSENDTSIDTSITETGDSDCDVIVVFSDVDGDGFGSNHQREVCEILAGFVTNNDDCDDTNDAIHPRADEICNDIDDDCDGIVDEDVKKTTFYEDADGDGYHGTVIEACTRPDGTSLFNEDCDDASPVINPGEEEICDDIDQDCDGDADGTEIDPCICVVETYDSSEYIFCDAFSGGTYVDNVSWCEARGYSPVKIEREEENTWLVDIAQENKLTIHSHQNGLYIGLTDAAVETTFEWPDFTSPIYTNWSDSSTNTSSNDCVELNITGPSVQGTWNVLDCSTNYGFICEAPI